MALIYNILILLALNLSVTKASSKLDLAGNWNLEDTVAEYYGLTAQVPGGIYSDLTSNNIIEDIFYGYQDVNTRWVAKRNWIYHRYFEVTGNIFNKKHVNIVFEGLDTFAAIKINNQDVASTENMFVQYEYDIKPFLQIGENNISVTFESPINKAKELFDIQAEDYIVPPECPDKAYNGECYVNHIRKMQASFSWDWGPAFPSVGIWKPVYIEAYDSSVIRYVLVDMENNANAETWDISLRVYFPLNHNIDAEDMLEISIPTELSDVVEVTEIVLMTDKNGDVYSFFNFSIPQLSVNLWWPNGFGQANLYPLNVTFVSESKNEVSTKIQKIGFRTVELIQDELTQGRTFYFAVNRVPIFAKGSNSIPLSILPEKDDDEEYIRFLLGSAKDVHMNMLRVWGGGLYESDTFYEVADEMGILIWQDFMFACAMYPVSDGFLGTVREEVRHQVKRLQYHPSIVIWAGNNENEVALRGNWYGTSHMFSKFAEDYVTLYIDTVKEEVTKIDTSKDFLTSSPTNGIESDNEGYIAKDPYSKLYGDVHFYNYFVDSWIQTIYPVPRFSSEYGYQSLPGVQSWLTANSNVSDLEPTSQFMDHRQHLPGGNDKLKFLIESRLKLPSESNENYYKAYIYYSQVIQAVAVKIQTELYRLKRSSISTNGEGMTMGALYWQLNDVWVAPSWSGIDFQHKWKMLHYFAKDFFAPLVIAPEIQVDNSMKLFAVSDLTQAVYNATLTIVTYNWESLIPVNEHQLLINFLPGSSREVFGVWIPEYLSQFDECGSNILASKCFLYLRTTDTENKLLAPNNFVFPVYLKNIDLPQANVTIHSVAQEENKLFKITLTTDKISLFVWLESGEIKGKFSENGFLQVDQVKEVYFYSEESVNASTLSDSLTVIHLMDKQFL